MASIRPRRQRSATEQELLRRAETDDLSSRRSAAKSGAPRGSIASGTSSSDSITAAITFFVGACVCVFLFFENPYLRPFEAYRLVNCAVLLWVPCMVILLFLKQDLQHFGLTRGDRKLGLKYALIASIVMIPILVIASLQSNFQTYYGGDLAQNLAMVGYAARRGLSPPVSPLGLLYYEGMMGFYLFCWEFFFRGFLLFGLSRARYVGNIGAVVLQAIPFALLHWSIVVGASKPPAEIFSAFIGGLILGWLALRAKSFVYGFIVHWFIALCLDMLLIAPMLLHHNFNT